MDRIIRVSGCHDCVPDYTNYEYEGKKACGHPEKIVRNDDMMSIFIQHHIDTKTLPDNCPLEKIEDLEQLASLARIGSNMK